MSTNSINKVEKYPPDLLLFSKEGDKVLFKALQGLVDQRSITKKMMSKLLTNERLRTFKKPFKLKMKCRWINRRKANCFYGDQVEAYIYFLEINYGRDAVKRYILRNINVFNKI